MKPLKLISQIKNETANLKRPDQVKKSIKQQTVYLPIPVYEQIRRLAFEERCKMHDLLMEGLE